jgi:hypothetical protein
MKANIYALGFGSLSVESSKVVGGNNVFYFSGGLRYARLFAGRPRNK